MSNVDGKATVEQLVGEGADGVVHAAGVAGDGPVRQLPDLNTVR